MKVDFKRGAGRSAVGGRLCLMDGCWGCWCQPYYFEAC